MAIETTNLIPNVPIDDPINTIQHYDPSVTITSPSKGDLIGPRVTVTGTADCDLVETDLLTGRTTRTKAVGAISKVEVDFGDGVWRQATKQGTTWASWSITRTRPTGVVTITAKVRAESHDILDITPGEDTNAVELVEVDATGPDLRMQVPPEGETFTWTEGGVPVGLEGTASDTRSGVAEVIWDLNNQNQFTPAEPKAPGDWSTWTATVILPEPGEHTITVHAKDGLGNLTPLDRKVTVEVSDIFVPRDPENVVSLAAYLDDLLRHAEKRVKIADAASSPALERSLLTDTFYQPFNALADPAIRTVANQPAHQVRLVIEVLRKYLDRHQVEVPAEAQSSYVQAAYELILRHLGTSYEELRLARAADAPARTALAKRLGIDLSPSRPDHLDRLLLEPVHMTEADLEHLLGLEATTDPIDDTVAPPKARVIPESQLLTWRREYLRALWQNQDAGSPSDEKDLGLMIDPDLISEADLQAPSAGNPAYDLWQERQDWVAGKLAELDGLRDPQATDLAVFDAITSSVLGPVSELVTLAEEHEQGHDIRPQLADMQLSLVPFLHLMRLRKLAASAPSAEEKVVLESEWADVYSILVQVQKVRETPTWRDEELAQGLTLGPDIFKLDTGAIPPLELPRWRASQRARRAWLDRLEGRINQEQTVIQALQSAIEATAEATLPAFRDALVAATDPATDPSEVANQLTHELAIDVKSDGSQKTTRVNQAIVTLQTVLFSLRTGRFVTPHPAAEWQLNPDDGYTDEQFDLEWQWMGAYAAWRAAMVVFAYPDNYLDPILREPLLREQHQRPSVAFEALVKRLRDFARLTPDSAREEAANYLDDLRVETALPDALQDPSFTLTDQMSEAQLAERGRLVRELFQQADPPITDAHRSPNGLLRDFKELFLFVPTLLAMQLQKDGEYLAALDWYQNGYAYNLSGHERKVYYGLELEEQIENQFQRLPDWPLEGLNPHDIAVDRAHAYTRFTVKSLVQCFLEFADAEFTRDTRESILRARALYLSALELLDLPELQPDPSPENPFPPNPVLRGLRQQVELNLFKLRSGLNIAGMQRPSFLESPRSETLNSHPIIGTNGQIGLSSDMTFHPTPYRYNVLIERAKQLTATAQQIEAAYLAAIEKYDAERYNMLKAQQDIDLTRAGVALQDLRVTEAQRGVLLAERQRGRAELQVDHFEELLSQGRSGYENLALFHLALSLLVPDSVGLNYGPKFSASVSISPSGKLQTMANIFSTMASYERREQEWRFQRDLAQHDILTSTQQVALARDHAYVVEQERIIARIQADQTQETLDFLANKFTNVEFYAWMRVTLGRIYRFFLQRGAAMARLAQDQLAFERQENPPNFIQADYWEVPAATGTLPYPNGAEPDRRGINGSALLLQDIEKLNLHAFETNQRKLQLSQTFALSQLMPAEFQRFRETGVLQFAFPMELFDRAFPGHYLRLIKRVRTSVIALIPPTQGIRATLKASGISQVAIGQDMIRPIVARREPELVALTSPINATGLFELQPKDGLLGPFEHMGVNTQFELEMPKAANPFDYRTISDILITIDYTALYNDNYRQQIVQQFDRKISADQPFSFRHQFADQWYDLHNPEQSPTPMAVRFETHREDFPPNVEHLKIQHVVLAMVRANGASFEVPVNLQFTEQGSSTRLGGEATTQDGVVSTRRSNGISWIDMTGDRTPFGTWELIFPEEVSTRFQEEEIEDILFVLTYRGETPAWPA